MNNAISLLEQLREDDRDWLLENAQEQRVERDTVLIRAGEPARSIFLVAQGLLGVFADRARIATVGPGSLVGEMSWVEDRPPTESVVAVEASLLLVLPHERLSAQCAADPAFAARLHRAIATLLSQRLRVANAHLRARSDEAPVQEGDGGGMATVLEGLAAFKEWMRRMDKAALSNGGVVPEALAAEFLAQPPLYAALESMIGDAAPVGDYVRESVGALAQREMLPYLLLTENGERMYSKPRGYAGDFYTIEKIYQNQAGGSGRIGPVLDRWFLDSPPCVAVRNRRALLAEEIGRTVEARGGETANVATLACGPAEEVFDVLAATPPEARRIRATLIDFDFQALAFVAEKRDRIGRLQRVIQLENENLIYLATGRSSSPLADQDLVYSIGLIDYFNDELVIKLLNWVHSVLRPGGRVILGNFHPRNTTKAFMDHVLEWRLIHRTEADMDRLYEASAFRRPSTNIRFEAQGINMFAECVKG